MGFSIWDILREADGDEQQPEANTTDTADSPEATEAPAEDNNAGGDQGGDDDFSIDTSLDNTDGGDDAAGGDDMGSDSGGDDGANKNDGEDGDDEPVEANTDMFASLSAEEQTIKIKELKKLYNDLYTSIDDLIERISNIDYSEMNITYMFKINNTLYDLKQYVSDYMIHVFPTKSYYENDVMFNRFLLQVNSISAILEKIYKDIAKNDKYKNVDKDKQ